MYCYEYPRPMVTVDILLFHIDFIPAKVLLVKRGHEPFKNLWAIPGGFIEMDEEMERSARRELKEETGLKNIPIVRTTLHDKLGRDPRGRTITAVYTGLISGEVIPKAGDDAAEASWFALNALPDLAFDHDEIIEQNREVVFRKILFEGWESKRFFGEYSENELAHLAELFGIELNILPDMTMIRHLHQINKLKLKKLQ